MRSPIPVAGDRLLGLLLALLLGFRLYVLDLRLRPSYLSTNLTASRS